MLIYLFQAGNRFSFFLFACHHSQSLRGFLSHVLVVLPLSHFFNVWPLTQLSYSLFLLFLLVSPRTTINECLIASPCQ